MLTVVPIVTLATSSGLTFEVLNIDIMALFIPKLGFAVVGSLCLFNGINITVILIFGMYVTYQAMMLLSTSDARSGSRITPSVFVLCFKTLLKNGTQTNGREVSIYPPTSTPMRRFFEDSTKDSIALVLNVSMGFHSYMLFDASCLLQYALEVVLLIIAQDLLIFTPVSA